MSEKFLIHDIESLSNFFSIGFRDYDTGQRKEFVIHATRNDLVPLIKFLRAVHRNGYTLIGFNNLGYDAQLLEWMFSHYSQIKHWDGERIAIAIHDLSNKIINLPREDRFANLIPEWRLTIPHIDVFKQQHYDAPNKATSLKWLEFTMRFNNIESMPFPHTHHVEESDISAILSYMGNDVDATYHFFKLIKFETELRQNLSAEYQLNLLSASEPRMARDIFGKFLCEKMNMRYRDLKEMRTFRRRIYVNQLLFKYIGFRDPILKGLHEFFKGLEFDPLNFPDNNYELAKVKQPFKYHNITGDVGLGGIHGCVAPGVYESSKVWFIEDIDGKSYYPKIGIENNLFPEHLSFTFCKTYKELYEKRQTIPKDNPVNYIYKIILNASYGLSKEPNNYFHDPAYTFAITINGQLMLLKLAEMMKEEVPGVMFYQFNTDGITIGYDPKHKDKVDAVKEKWSKVTRIPLENKFYSKLVIRDVNNYLAIDKKNGKVKRKGLFAYSLDPADQELYYHKNPSALIVPKALEAYFAKGVPFEKFVMGNKDIFDFCYGVKVKRDFNIVQYSYNKQTQQIDQEKINQQVVRYYISNEQMSLKKRYKAGSKTFISNAVNTTKKRNMNIKRESNVEELHKGRNMTYYNIHQVKPIDQYGINYKHYIDEVRSIVQEIEPNITNLKLF